MRIIIILQLYRCCSNEILDNLSKVLIPGTQMMNGENTLGSVNKKKNSRKVAEFGCENLIK